MPTPNQHRSPNQNDYRYDLQDPYGLNDPNDAQQQFDAYCTTHSDSATYIRQADGGHDDSVFIPSIDKPAYNCSMHEAFLRFWKKALDVKGRASRSEFWWWVLCDLLVVIAADLVLVVLYRVVGGSGSPSELFGKFSLMWKMATIIPFITLSIRRLHDSSHSGKLLVALLIASFAGTFLGESVGLTIGHGAIRTINGDVSLNGASASLGIAIIAPLLTAGSKITYIAFMALPSKAPSTHYDKTTPKMMRMASSIPEKPQPRATDLMMPVRNAYAPTSQSGTVHSPAPQGHFPNEPQDSPAQSPYGDDW